MSPIVFIVLLSASYVVGATPNAERKDSAREEKLRSALIDAFQNIKKASSKGGNDDLSPDLIGSMIPLTSSSKHEKFTTDDSFDLFADDDGLTFAEVFGDVETEKRVSSTEKAHNVQHIVKTTKQVERTTPKPSGDTLAKLTGSIRNTVNETGVQIRQISNETNLLGLESMLRVVDAEILVQQWGTLQQSVVGQCREDLQEYVEGLQDKLLWALKTIISGVYLWNNNDIKLYNSIKVAFPDDPCDNRKLKIPDFNAPGRRVSEVKCLEYIWQIRYITGKMFNKEECRMQKPGLHPDVAGGGPVAQGEYPHMAALGWKAKVGTWIFKCGGSLISEKFVLTAAHCSSVTKKDKTVADVKPKIVRLGSKNILDTVRGHKALDIDIKDFKTYCRHDPLKNYYDIALVELKEEAPFLWRVHPSCLWTEFDNPEMGTVTGWGVIETASLQTSPELQKAEIRIIDSDECDKTLYFRKNRKWRGVVRHQLCAGDKSGRIDTCKGDSGGPLQSNVVLNAPEFVGFTWKLHKIVGVTSFGFGCARQNTPGIYTRVASFIGWIENIVWPASNTTNHNEKLFCRN